MIINFFVCFLHDTTPICLINDYLYNFEEIECQQSNSIWSPEYKVLYFKETDDFMLISRYTLNTIILNNENNSVKKCGTKYLNGQRKNDVYSIIH